jgi:tellurite resistance protein
MFFDKLKGSLNRFSRNADLLEGVGGAIALVAMADGSVSDEEEKVAVDRAKKSKAHSC